jgi:hypothetical protein
MMRLDALGKLLKTCRDIDELIEPVSK